MRPIQIKGCEHYSVNEEGVVLNTESYKVLKTDLNNCGYRRVTLWSKSQKRVRIAVHRLVAIHYVDNPDNLPMVNHKDGNKLNNHYKNLEWVTCKENTRHAFDKGLRKGPNRMSFELARKIKSMNQKGYSYSKISKASGVNIQRVMDVCNRYYKDVS